MIRLEAVSCLQEVTYADLAEREYGYATGSRGFIGLKNRGNAKGNRLFGGWISGSIFGVFGRFFLCLSVIPAQPSGLFEGIVVGAHFARSYAPPPHSAERSLVQSVCAFGSDPDDPGSIVVGDTF